VESKRWTIKFPKENPQVELKLYGGNTFMLGAYFVKNTSYLLICSFKQNLDAIIYTLQQRVIYEY
jgi:hypothetical protein